MHALTAKILLLQGVYNLAQLLLNQAKQSTDKLERLNLLHKAYKTLEMKDSFI